MTDNPEVRLPSAKGYHWSDRQRQVAHDALLDAREAWKLSEREDEFQHDIPDTSGIEPNSVAGVPGRPISACERELADTLEWLDERIALLPDDEEE